MASGVYKITSPNNRIYVGSSKNIEKRWKEYRCLNCKSQIRLYNSFVKYGVENHVFELITECDVTEMLSIELHWGLFYNVLNRKSGLNCLLPKEGDVYGGFSDESIEKMRASTLGQKAWNKGIFLTDKQKENFKGFEKGNIPWNKGKKFSEESKKKMSQSSKGKTAWNRKLIIDWQTGIFYLSCLEASNILGIKRTTLQAMLSGQNKNKTDLQYV